MVYTQRWWTKDDHVHTRQSTRPILDVPEDAVTYQLGVSAASGTATYWSEPAPVTPPTNREAL
jgi:hypothetical protein